MTILVTGAGFIAPILFATGWRGPMSRGQSRQLIYVDNLETLKLSAKDVAGLFARAQLYRNAQPFNGVHKG
jgi:hypothetical protein